MTHLVGIFGAGGFGREVLPLVRGQLKRDSSAEHLVFVDDAPPAPQLNGHRVLTFDAFMSAPADTRSVILAVADPQARRRIDLRCAAAGVRLMGMQASNSLVLDDVVIGEGSILSPFVSVTSNVRIGRCFHANLYSYVAHDCQIGDYVTFAPSVICSGNVRIEDFAYLGAGAVVRQGVPGKPLVIGASAVIGMGAVVTKSVPPGVVVVGNPARPLKP